MLIITEYLSTRQGSMEEMILPFVGLETNDDPVQNGGPLKGEF